MAAAACAAWAGSGAAAPGKAVNDLLLLPAPRSERPAESVLLGVTRAGRRLVAVGERGHILTSDDDGTTWDQASVPVSVTLTAVCFASPETGWAVGHDGVVLRSTDGGRTWAKRLDGSEVDRLVLAHIERALEERRAAGAGANETDSLELFRRDTEAALEEGPSRPFLDVWFADEREGLVVGAFGLILRTADGGATWTPLIDRIDNPDGYHYYGIAAADNGLFLAGEMGMLFRSDDRGVNWERLESPYGGSYFGVLATPTSALAFGLRGRTVRSGDGGLRWELVPTPAHSALSGGRAFSDGSLWLVGIDGQVLRSTDSGRSFLLLANRFAGAAAIEEAADGSAIVVGTKGVKKIFQGKGN
jgi:photosystem II stability/assembly factor-like uncharacterized protein